MNTAKPKRQLALIIVLFLHGLVFLGGFCALGIGATVESLSPDSEQNRLHRTPRPDEAARGEVWFSGHIEELTPGRTADGVVRAADPWKGCSLRRQSYRSGKNAGWYDEGAIMSYGSALVVSDERGTQGRSVAIRLEQLGQGRRTFPSDDEVRESLPSVTAGELTSYRFVRDCFSAGWEVSVDGRSEGGVLVPMPGRLAARVETRDARVARLHGEAMWCSLGPLAYAGGLAWLAIFISILRTPGHLSAMFGPAFGRSLPGSQLAIAMPLVGLALGGLSYVSLFHSIAPLVVYGIAFSAFGLLIRWQAQGFALRRSLLSVLAGVEVSGVAAAWGKVSVPNDAPESARLPVVGTEVFTVGSKGAVRNKVHTHCEPDPFIVRDGDVTTTCDGSSCDFYGECRQQNEGGHDVRQSHYGMSGLTNNRYAVRVTILGQDADVVIVGPAAKGADSRASADDEHQGYRATGAARFFRREAYARVVVFQGTREDLRAYLDRDLMTLGLYRGLLAAWFAAALFSVVLAVKYTLL